MAKEKSKIIHLSWFRYHLFYKN